MMRKLFPIVFFIVCSIIAKAQNNHYLYVGSYTNGELKDGIYVFKLDLVRGQLKEIERIDSLINPSYLTLNQKSNHLYTCTNTKMDVEGKVASYVIDTITGKLTFINSKSTEGRNPVHLSTDKQGKYLIASNYTDASIIVFGINKEGAISNPLQQKEFIDSSVIKVRQDQAHIHSTYFNESNEYLFSPDLGADKIRVLSFNDGILDEVDSLTVKTQAGKGPRHIAFHPTSNFAYCVDELSGEISFYTIKGAVITYKRSYFSYTYRQDEYASSDIHISPDGRFLYVSNRQDEHSLSIFKINPQDGELALIGHQSTFGTIPRSFTIDPSGAYVIVANQTSNNLVLFSRNRTNGLLTKVSEVKDIDSPSSLQIGVFDEN